MVGKILIVDDDIDTLQLVGTMLERQGYKILAANNGIKALDVAQRESPDLILLDVMMPGMDGYEVTRKLRTMETTAFIPIIMFTAKAQVDDKVEGFEAGADDYLTKPTHPAELIARVKKILDRPKTGSLITEDTAPTMKTGFVAGIMAAKGGLGVSTLAMNLAGSIHKQTDEYVILAELTPGHGDIGVYLGYAQIESLNTLLKRDARDITAEEVEEELIKHGSGIDLLLSSHNPLDADLTQAVDQFEVIIKHLSRLAPYTVLDMGVGLSKANQKIARMCNNLVIVIEPTRHSIIQTEVLLKSLDKIGVQEKSIKIVLVNRLRMEITFPASQVQSELGHNLSGVLTPAPELAYQAAFRHELIINQQPDSLTAQQFSKLANTVVEWKKEAAS